MTLLDQQVALVVGAGGGIGRAVVRRYLAEGASVVGVDRNPERLAELTQEFPDKALSTLMADASTWDDSQTMVAATVERFGRLDVLVSCVGLWDQAIRLMEVPGDRLLDALQESVSVNVGSVLLNIRAAAEELKETNGRIVVTGSFASYGTSGGGVLYTAAKHALVGVVRQLAYEFAPDVRVNGVAPGVARTTMAGMSALGQEPVDAILEGTEDALPLQRLPDIDEYGGVYALLGSRSDSAAMTGTIIVADSGLLIRGLGGPHGGGVQ